ncbi:sigma-70 family RNA polymerase sigma factor [Streptacidiphilus anmyonensis]|uniref:sigma-70 family RNA polymerase sigma factor n=1 Tax=Streptacidiphilus anmyonensis TaxID=405782 RepID=UPI0005AB0D67|nr:sigma-70 family RNA polymerase sigma factor [Streptacidiphilus anmyonensis]
MTEWSDQLAQLVRARGAELSRYGYLLCGDVTEGADLFQEALVRVFARPRRSWSLGDVEGYVRRTMLNDFLDRRRRSRRFARLLPRLSSPEVAPDHSGGVVRRQDVVEALATLSPRQRACVVLRYYEDLPVAGVTERIGLSQGAVKRYLSEALARMSAVVDPPWRETEKDPDGLRVGAGRSTREENAR